MGITIEYYTKSEVDSGQVAAIVAASKEPNQQPWLLCEPIAFLAMPGYEDRLFGASKLNLMPDPAELKNAEAEVEKNDLEFLLDQLGEISKRFGVAWQVALEGSPVGSIENGVCEPSVREAIEALAGVAEELGDFGDLGDLV